MPLPPRGKPPVKHEGVFASVIVVCLLIAGIVVAWAYHETRNQYPLEPSAWDGRSVELVVPTPAPDAFLLNFAEFVDLAEGPFGAVVQGWEAEPECKIPAPDNNRLYPVCTFKGSGLVMRVEGYASGKLESIKFTFDRYHMATATQLFNRIVWETGFEKQGEAARKLVDKELDETTDRYAADTVDRIYVQAYFSDYLRDLVIKFSE